MRLAKSLKLKLFCFLCLSLVLVSCGNLARQQNSERSDIEMTFEINPNPPGIGPSQMTITLKDSANRPIDQAQLSIIGTLPEQELELRMAAKAKNNGTYQTPFVWSANGDWTVTVNATLANGQTAEQEFNVTVEDKVSLDVGGSGHEEGEHNHSPRVPNEGAAIYILSPQDGSTFEAGEEVKLEVSTDNFVVGEEGRHWHVYVDSLPGQMIMGQITNAALRNLEPGEHRISTYLSIGGHEELKEGATVNITVLSPEESGLTQR